MGCGGGGGLGGVERRNRDGEGSLTNTTATHFSLNVRKITGKNHWEESSTFSTVKLDEIVEKLGGCGSRRGG